MDLQHEQKKELQFSELSQLLGFQIRPGEMQSEELYSLLSQAIGPDFTNAPSIVGSMRHNMKVKGLNPRGAETVAGFLRSVLGMLEI